MNIYVKKMIYSSNKNMEGIKFINIEIISSLLVN